MTFWPMSLPPSPSSSTDAIIRSQVQNQSPVKWNWPVQKKKSMGIQWQHIVMMFPQKRNLTVYWAESNKGWVKDAAAAPVHRSNQKSKFQDRGLKTWTGVKIATNCERIIGRKDKKVFIWLLQWWKVDKPSSCGVKKSKDRKQSWQKGEETPLWALTNSS